MKNEFKEYGKHYLVEFIGCDGELLQKVESVRGVLINAARKSRANIIAESFFQFEPHGVSGVLHIAESHFSIHTWPEDGYAAFDVLTCGDMDAFIAIGELKRDLKAKEMKTQVVVRGY